MESICGADCSICGFKKNCAGCKETCGSPFGGRCVAAEYIRVGGKDAFEQFKKRLICEFNALNIEGMPEIKELHCLCGSFVNLEYPLPNGDKVKMLEDKNIYLGNQVMPEFASGEEDDVCYGLVAGMNFLLVCEYRIGGASPEIVIYKRR